MPDMTREECLKVFEERDLAAWRFHMENPKAFSENSVSYAKYLLRVRKEGKIS